MRALSGVARQTRIEIDRSDVRDDEQMFGSVLAEIAKKLWPKSTAANLAAEIGCSERAVEFYLAGDRKWSGDAIAAIVAEILRRHSMRNVKVSARK